MNSAKAYSNIFVALDLVAAILLGTGLSGPLVSLLLLMVSLPLVLLPSSILPVMFVASWSGSFAVFGASAFLFYEVLFVFSLLFARDRVSFKSFYLPATIAVFLFSVWLLLSGFLSVSGDYHIAIKLFLFIGFAVIGSMTSVHDLSICRRSFLYIAVFYSLFFLVRAVFFPLELADEEQMTIEVTLIPGVGTNGVAQVIVVMYSYLFCSSLSRRQYHLVPFALLYFISLFFLGSRTAMYTSLIVSAVYVLFVLDMKFQYKMLTVAVSAAALLVLVSMGSSFENFQRLDTSTIADDQGSGRFINWSLYFLYIVPNNLLKGIGPGYVNYNVLGYRSDADNLYVDLLCELGIPGVVLFLVAYVLVARKCAKTVNPTRKGLCLIIVLSFLVIGMGETVFDSELFWFVVGCALIVSNTKRKYKVRLISVENNG